MNYEELLKILEEQLRGSNETIETLKANSVVHLETIKAMQINSSVQLETIKNLESIIVGLRDQITQLENKLLEKDKKTDAIINRLNGIEKSILPKKNEKRKLVDNSLKDTTPAPTPKERGNNGAKRKEYDNLVKIVDYVEPTHPEFLANKDDAKYAFFREAIRYEYIPPKLIKHIYRCNKYILNEKLYEAKPPTTPLLGSNYDSSVMAFLMNYRYTYGLPIERIVSMCKELGMDIPKATAHKLVQKGAEMLERLQETLKDAILEQDYINFDESFHTILDKNKPKGSFKGCIWVALANRVGLINYFVNDKASKNKESFTDYVPVNYSGAIQTDGNVTYKVLEGWDYRKAIRLGCIQHCKRNYINIVPKRESEEIIGIYNEFYHIRKNRAKSEWVEESQKVFKKLSVRLRELEREYSKKCDGDFLKALAYSINELPSIENIINSTDYKLDNNDIERPMRYISISRRNSLFSGSVKGAKRMALLYSLAVSCKLNRVNSFVYFKDTLNRLAQLPIEPTKEMLRELLPDRWGDDDDK